MRLLWGLLVSLLRLADSSVDFRQAEIDDIADGLQAAAAGFIERIGGCVPVRIIEIDKIDGWNSGFQIRHMVVGDFLVIVGKLLCVAKRLRRIPEDVL